ncbi:MAG: HEAT repeat domain-containing protein [Anaerolineae bacterium]|jgi:HEAT repeat protein|nr:HEAT repeat domain-containing protein [Anaerolineae bacterium]
MHTITLGRRPTFGEVVDYYMQEQFLRYLLDTTSNRRVVLVIAARKHWEPNWETDGIRGGNTDDLRRWIQGKVQQHLAHVSAGDRPDYYPAFHQSVWRGRADQQVMDCIFEADLPSWRDAFRDVGTVVALLEQYGVPYQCKFSGHRSLHIVIPGEAMPPGYRGTGARRLARQLLRWSHSQAHTLPRITRMPYSLNEDTGLVCLPIEPGLLRSFRPWQANLHLVDISKQPHSPEVDESHQDHLAQLLQDLGNGAADITHQGSVTNRPTYVIDDPDRVLAPYRDRLKSLHSSGAIGHVWARLAGDLPVTNSELMNGLLQDDPDVAWLWAEAYVFHGTTVTPQVFEALLTQEEEYARASATDILLRFERVIVPLVVQAIRELTVYTAVGAKAAYLLTQSPWLRQAVFDAISASADDAHDARITVACLTGAVTSDWCSALALLEPIRKTPELPPHERARLRRKIRALEIMATLGGWDKVHEDEKARRLAALGPEVTELLLMAANSPEPRFRRGIVTALAVRADPRATEVLIRALNDDYTKVRQKAVGGLVRIGRPAVAHLISAADSDQTRIRRYALLCLGRIALSDPEAAARARNVVAGALADGEEAVRRTAIRAMASMATLDDLDILTALLGEAEPEIAIAATLILEALGMEGTEALGAMAIGEHVPAAAYYIARQGDARGSEILAAQLGDESKQKIAVEYLRELRDPRCVSYLVEQIRESTDWRGIWLAQELGAIGGDIAVQALIETLSRDAHLMRRGAVRGLDTARDPAAIPALVDALDDADGKVRKLAADALVRFGEVATGSLHEALARTGERDGRRRSILTQILGRLERSAPSAQS